MNSYNWDQEKSHPKIHSNFNFSLNIYLDPSFSVTYWDFSVVSSPGTVVSPFSPGQVMAFGLLAWMVAQEGVKKLVLSIGG